MSEDTPLKHLQLQRGFAAVFIAAILLSLSGAQKSPVAAALLAGERISVLIFGTDASEQSQHTDTLMAGIFNPLENSLSVLSIPRDTRIRLPGYRFHRVNEIFGYHMRRTKDAHESSLKVKEGVETILSTDDKPAGIPYFVNVDYSGFEKIVDLVGGVWVDIDIPMHYDDYAGSLHIHFEPGRYLLKGEDALRYVRYRGLTGDRGRIYRQQMFIRNLAKRMAHPAAAFKLPKMLQEGFASVHTNISFWDAVYALNAVRRIRPPDIGFYILPGQPLGPYWQIRQEAADRLVAMIFHGEQSESGFLEPVVALEGQITVNVWNASGKTGLAYELTRHLRRSGFDVVDWGTYPAEQIPTRVIDRKGQISNAQRVAASLGAENFHSDPNPSALVDVEVVLGRDYAPPVLLTR